MASNIINKSTILDFPKDVTTDVLIVGAGPSGYMAGISLQRYGVNIRIIDQRSHTIQGGQAGGIQPRTQEVLQTFASQNGLEEIGNHVSESTFWTVTPDGGLGRTHIKKECIHPSQFPYILAVPQRETELQLDATLREQGDIVDRPTELINFHYVDDPEYPIHAIVRHIWANTTTTYKCKYLIGGDGAGSVTRKAMKVASDFSDNDDVWCVADLMLDTNFPDHRRRCHVRTPQGAMMMIPSAGGLNRIYTQLSPDEIEGLGGVENQAKSDGVLMATGWKDAELRNIMEKRVHTLFKPYHGHISQLQWISQYRIKQRVIDSFWDKSRVFVMGDACHTHSPKAAQGLNISMMDAYNLTWKIAHVLQGTAKHDLLQTYETERLQIAQELIGFDRKISVLYTKKDELDNNAHLAREYYTAHGFTCGVGLHYKPNPAVQAKVTGKIDTESAEPLIPGKRLLAPWCTRHVDGTEVDLLDDMPSNGRYHLYIWAGKHAFDKSKLESAAAWLNSASSPLTRYNVPSIRNQEGRTKMWQYENIRRTRPENYGRTVDLYLIHTADYYETYVEELPEVFHDWRYRVYADDMGGKQHRDRGIDPEVGAMTLVRPDGYVGIVTGLDEGEKITQFMDGFLNVKSTEQIKGSIKHVNGLADMVTEAGYVNGVGSPAGLVNGVSAH